MINTVLQAIERFESSPGFEAGQLPTSIYESNVEDETNTLVDTEGDTSDDSDDYKDAQESCVSEEISVFKDPVHIKQTLKDKIRIRRESEGAGEITNLFEPPKQYELTPEEEQKNEIRKKRNRLSATKSRLKRIEQEKKLEEDATNLENEHEKLTKEVNILKKAKLIYFQILKGHLSSCQRVATVLKSTKSTASDTASSSSAAPAASRMPNRINNDNGGTQSSHSSLLTQHHLHQSSQIHWPLKRKTADDVGNQPFKIPKPLDESQTTHLDNRLINTVAQTCQNEVLRNNICTTSSQINICNSVQSVAIETRMGDQCNTAKPVCNNQTPFPGTNHNQVLGTYATTASKVNEKASLIGESLETCLTEEQKINRIKQYLLDGFKITSQR